MSDTPRTDAPPERIFLQWDGDQEPDDYSVHIGVTWSDSRVFKHDVEYVSAKKHTELERENNQLRAVCKRLLDAHEHINCTTMSHVVSPEHGFERCKTIARTAIAEYREVIDKARSATP